MFVSFFACLHKSHFRLYRHRPAYFEMLYHSNAITTFLRVSVDGYNCTYTQLTVMVIFCTCLHRKTERDLFLLYRFLISCNLFHVRHRELLAIYFDLSLISSLILGISYMLY